MLRSAWLFALGALMTSVSEARSCAELASVALEGVRLHSTVTVPASEALPEYCRVTGTIGPATNFEARLPTAAWNGKFYMAGCGGFCGKVDAERPDFSNAINHGLARGYAVATTDSGHWGANSTDGRWARNNRRAEEDWGWRAVTDTARVSKQLIERFYGRPQQRAYFAGCSTGGRMALMEATRFPQDFDGIIAGAPAMDYTGLVATAFAWLMQSNTSADGREILARDKVPMIADAVIEACDAKDGTSDGLIDDPRACDWQPRQLSCDGASRTNCLTVDEVGVLEHWYRPAQDSTGHALMPGGLPRGSEPFWPVWLSGRPGTDTPSMITAFTRDFLRYMAFAEDPDPNYTVSQFDLDRDPARLATMSAVYDADSGDLAAFKARGGKLLLYHGWADPIVTPWATLEYYAALEKRFGGPDATREFARLFMLPGFDHCGLQRGAGADNAGFDPLPALEAWVERGEGPDTIDTQRRNADGSIEWSRPVCAYPRVARLRSPAASTTSSTAAWQCAEPPR
jgi:feruloyl esterase